MHSSTLVSIDLHCSLLLYIALNCTAFVSIPLHLSILLYIALHRSTFLLNGPYYFTLLYIRLHWSPLVSIVHCSTSVYICLPSTLHWSTFVYKALYRSTFLLIGPYCLTLLYIRLHWSPLVSIVHCSTSVYIGLLSYNSSTLVYEVLYRCTVILIALHCSTFRLIGLPC